MSFWMLFPIIDVAAVNSNQLTLAGIQRWIGLFYPELKPPNDQFQPVS